MVVGGGGGAEQAPRRPGLLQPVGPLRTSTLGLLTWPTALGAQQAQGTAHRATPGEHIAGCAAGRLGFILNGSAQCPLIYGRPTAQTRTGGWLTKEG